MHRLHGQILAVLRRYRAAKQKMTSLNALLPSEEHSDDWSNRAEEVVQKAEGVGNATEVDNTLALLNIGVLYAERGDRTAARTAIMNIISEALAAEDNTTAALSLAAMAAVEDYAPVIAEYIAGAMRAAAQSDNHYAKLVAARLMTEAADNFPKTMEDKTLKKRLQKTTKKTIAKLEKITKKLEKILEKAEQTTARPAEATLSLPLISEIELALLQRQRQNQPSQPEVQAKLPISDNAIEKGQIVEVSVLFDTLAKELLIYTTPLDIQFSNVIEGEYHIELNGREWRALRLLLRKLVAATPAGGFISFNVENATQAGFAAPAATDAKDWEKNQIVLSIADTSLDGESLHPTIAPSAEDEQFMGEILPQSRYNVVRSGDYGTLHRVLCERVSKEEAERRRAEMPSLAQVQHYPVSETTWEERPELPAPPQEQHREVWSDYRQPQETPLRQPHRTAEERQPIPTMPAEEEMDSIPYFPAEREVARTLFRREEARQRGDTQLLEHWQNEELHPSAPQTYPAPWQTT